MVINQKYIISVVALIFGFLVVTQIKSFSGVNDIFVRDNQSNIFQEIKILKAKNEDLRKETEELETTLDQLDDQTLALSVIDEEINKYKKLSGKYPIFGPGVSITITGEITTPWVVDLVNEFFNSGAQSVSVNGIRITNQTSGFDTMPQGQILLNGSILSSPYVFNVIGDSSIIVDILELPSGIFERLVKTFPNTVIETTKKEVIQMN
jgi:uncharacterized protein YlxW (UPF0749 family)